MAQRPEPPLMAEDIPDTLAHDENKLPNPAETLSFNQSEPDTAPPGEPPDAVDAFEVGLRFLRDATEQYNYESALRPEFDRDAAGEPVAQLISEATLESANQSDFAVPVSGALSNDLPDVPFEPSAPAVDLTSGAIAAASLFDQPVAELDDEVEEEAAEDDPDVVRARPLREPRVLSDDPSDVDDERLEQIQRAFDERVKKRLRVSELPKERSSNELGQSDHRQRPTPAGVRHAARAIQSSQRAATIIREMTGLADTVTALAALESVAGGIVRRITPAEASQFISQLPSELHDVLLALPAGPDRNITRETINADLASRLSVVPERAAALARGVGAALCVLISRGEIADLRAQLPPDIRDLLPERVVHQNP
jgi:uncharacterized protein (DUF2267 family)